MKTKQFKQLQEKWSYQGGTDPNIFRKVMSKFSTYIRNKQYKIFIDTFKPTPIDKILDIGVSPDATLQDTNFFEQIYPFKKNLSIASIEDCRKLVTRYKLAEYIKMIPNSQLNVEDKAFKIAVSWATLEHVGSRVNQENFVRELCRIGQNVFITTPDRHSIYEPHTVIFLLHWLPQPLFRKILKLIGKRFWSEEQNLNILSMSDAKRIIKNTPLKIKRFRILGFLPSHILIYGCTFPSR